MRGTSQTTRHRLPPKGERAGRLATPGRRQGRGRARSTAPSTLPGFVSISIPSLEFPPCPCQRAPADAPRLKVCHTLGVRHPTGGDRVLRSFGPAILIYCGRGRRRVRNDREATLTRRSNLPVVIRPKETGSRKGRRVQAHAPRNGQVVQR
jgi:hypothetical protein